MFHNMCYNIKLYKLSKIGCDHLVPVNLQVVKLYTGTVKNIKYKLEILK
jgi:hypothetical protein